MGVGESGCEQGVMRGDGVRLLLLPSLRHKAAIAVKVMTHACHLPGWVSYVHLNPSRVSCSAHGTAHYSGRVGGWPLFWGVLGFWSRPLFWGFWGRPLFWGLGGRSLFWGFWGRPLFWGCGGRPLLGV